MVTLKVLLFTASTKVFTTASLCGTVPTEELNSMPMSAMVVTSSFVELGLSHKSKNDYITDEPR